MSAALKKIVVVGVGLIGGSFTLALRKAGAIDLVIGVGRSAASLQRAQELGLIDAHAPMEDALRDADLVLLSVPVAQTEAVLASMKPYLSSKTVVTDAGSIKTEVVAAARRALGERIGQFVPGHPIAGREVSGPDAAIADLYLGKKVVLTPLAENTEARVELVADAWRRCGAELHRLSPEQHDAIFAAVSHLPHLLSFAFMDEVLRKPNADLLLQYAASGFRGFTRLASSSPEMWRDISIANRNAILDELDAYIAQLAQLRKQLADGDAMAMQAMFTHAQQARDAWLRRTEAATSPEEKNA
jgi:prephenate dehydrogenase